MAQQAETMTLRLDTRSADFAQKFRAFLDTKREASADVEATVRGIVSDVAARGDDALKAYTLKLDRLDLDKTEIRVTPEQIAAAHGACGKSAFEALALARTAFRHFTGGKYRKTIALPTRSASSSVRAGLPSMRSAFMCPAARPHIRPRC